MEISYSAGTFVCNHVFYQLMDALTQTDIPAGFIHVPALEEDETTLTAHPDTGGVEGGSLARIRVDQAQRILEIALRITVQEVLAN